jgi:stress-induced morphogen
MPMSAAVLEAELRAAFPDAEIAIDDLAGDGDHYRARIVSSVFKGLPRLRQHQLVYAALKGKVGGELHALALETAAPAADKGA